MRLAFQPLLNQFLKRGGIALYELVPRLAELTALVFVQGLGDVLSEVQRSRAVNT